MWLLVGLVKKRSGGRDDRFVKTANVGLDGGKTFQ